MSDHARWLEAALAAVPSQVLAWRGPEALRSSLKAWLELQLGRVSDPAFGEGFAQGCPWPGATPADYLQRDVAFPGGEALVGIRFRGGSLDFRFVDLVVARGARTPESLAAACRAALEACAPFAPLAVRVRQASDALLDPAGWRVEVDQRFLAGRLDELAANSPPPDPSQPTPGVLLDKASPADALAFTSQAYATWALSDPALAAKVQPSGLDELEDCHETGLLAFVLEGDERVGVIGLARSEDAELEGYLMEEEVIALSARGRRLAAQAQRLVIAALAPEHPNALLFGTIDAANVPSIRTARRVGREEVATYRFLFPPS